MLLQVQLMPITYELQEVDVTLDELVDLLDSVILHVHVNIWDLLESSVTLDLLQEGVKSVVKSYVVKKVVILG